MSVFPLSRLLLFAGPLILTGCIAKTVVGVATMPVKAGSKVVDWTTTSQSEADRNRGRAMRKQDKALDKLNQQYQRHMDECDSGQQASCTLARQDYARMEAIRDKTR